MTTVNGVRRPVRPTTGEQVCDGVHPATGEPCVLGQHKGYHETVDGLRWLDN